MCKFNQNLFLVTLIWCMLRISAIRASPIDHLLFGDSADDQSNITNDFDMRFDQRQNGTENIRLRIDGVLLAFPSAVSSSAGSIASNAAANYLLELAAAAEDADNDNDNDNDTYNYFNLLKNSNDASATEKASVGGNKDEKLAPPTNEDELKNIIIVKEHEDTKSESSIDVAKQSSTTIDEEQIKSAVVVPIAPVVPAKKIQSRRRNKHKLRLGGLIDFLERFRDRA